jgi:hypothetical protein
MCLAEVALVLHALLLAYKPSTKQPGQQMSPVGLVPQNPGGFLRLRID